MTEAEATKRQRIWTPTIIITLVFLILLIILTYLATALGLLWTIGIGAIYGVSVPLGLILDHRTKGKYNARYWTQLIFLITSIAVFIRLQQIFQPHSLSWDYISFGLAMVFFAAVLGLPTYRYIKSKFPKSEDKSSPE